MYDIFYVVAVAFSKETKGTEEGRVIEEVREKRREIKIFFLF